MSPAPSPTAEPPTVAAIVLADDDDDLRDVYACALRGAGYAVTEAADGRAALEAVRRVRPSALLLDVWMPEMDGLAVLDALRHDPAGHALKVLVVSNLSDADSRLRAFEAGATEYLVKGCALADLLALLAALLEA